MATLLEQNDFLRKVFDAIPAMLLIVDQDVRILHVNATAATQLGVELVDIHAKRGGEVFHCIHASEDEAGCGHAPACKDCLIRNAVSEALRGNSTYRQSTRMVAMQAGLRQELFLLVTAAPFDFEGKIYTLLTLENVNELIRLKGLLPICMHCKRIRTDEGYWKDVAEYFSAHIDVDFTHGLCRDCMKHYYPHLSATLPDDVV